MTKLLKSTDNINYSELVAWKESLSIKSIAAKFSVANTKFYNPILSIFSASSQSSINGTPSFNENINNENITLKYEDGMMVPKDLARDPLMMLPGMYFRDETMVRNYLDTDGHWDQLCSLSFKFDGNDQWTFTDDHDPIIKSPLQTASEIDVIFTLSGNVINENKAVYVKLQYNCDDISEHTHILWGCLKVTKDENLGITNISWSIL